MSPVLQLNFVPHLAVPAVLVQCPHCAGPVCTSHGNRSAQHSFTFFTHSAPYMYACLFLTLLHSPHPAPPPSLSSSLPPPPLSLSLCVCMSFLLSDAYSYTPVLSGNGACVREHCRVVHWSETTDKNDH